MSALLLALYGLVGGAAEPVPLLKHFFDTFTTPPASVQSIARFDLDVDGDAIPEIFLGLPGNQYGQDWVVYQRVRDGIWKSLGVVRFHFRAFYYDVGERRLWAYVRLTAERGGFAQFRLTPSGFVEDQDSAKRDFRADKARAETWRRPLLGWAKVADLSAGREVWTDLETGTEVMSSLGLANLMIR